MADQQTTDPVEAALAVLRAYGIQGEDHRLRAALVDALDAAEDATERANQCDEPGCKRQACCGFPTPAGYRRTCSAHSEVAAHG